MRRFSWNSVSACALAAILSLVSLQAHAILMLGGSASSVGATFNYYISASGSASNAGTSASPFDLSVLSGAPTAHNASYWQSLLAGQRVGLIGTLPAYSYYAAVLTLAGSGNYGSALGVPGGTQASPTYIGCSNSSGYEVERSCTIDAHQGATSGQGSVTSGVYAMITSITTGNPTVVHLNNSAATNPFASLVGDSVVFSSASGTDFSAIGITSVQNNADGGSLYTISAVGGTSGSWTVSLSTTTSGTYTAGTNPLILWNYPAVEAAIIGQTKNCPFTSNFGWWEIRGVNITGGLVNAVEVAPGAAYQDGTFQISAISIGSSTTVTVNSTAGSNPFASGSIVEIDGVTGISGLNYATGAGTFTVSSVGGSSGAWTFTIPVTTSGSLTSSTAYVSNKVPGVTIEDSEIYDVAGDPGSEPAAIYTESSKGLLVQNDKLHDVNAGITDAAGLEGSGFESFYCDDCVVQYSTVYNVPVGIWHKSYPMTGAIVRYNFVQAVPNTNLNSIGIFEGVGQIITGLTSSVYNNILMAATAWGWEWTDSQTPYAGSEVFYNNTVYYPTNSGATSVSGSEFPASASSAGRATLSPQPTATNYNNIYNQTAAGSTLYGESYVTGAATGTAGAPTNINLSLSNYNLYDISSGTVAFTLSGYTLPLNFGGLGTYTLATWQSDTGLDANSALGTPTYTSGNLGYQYPTSDFALTTGSTGHLMGHVGGTSGGAAIDIGAWGGTDVNTSQPIAQIGSSF